MRLTVVRLVRIKIIVSTIIIINDFFNVGQENTIGSLRFATRGLKTAYRSLDASAVKGIPL